jgi:hypothetical protein
MSDALTLIATFSHPFEAHLAKGKLESEGIEAFIADENIVGINWLYSNLVGGVKLKVREEDKERALKILQEKVPLLELVPGGKSASPIEKKTHGKPRHRQ